MPGLKQRVRAAVEALDHRLGTDVWQCSWFGLRLARDVMRGRRRLEVLAAAVRFAGPRRGAGRTAVVHVPVDRRTVRLELPDASAFKVLGEVLVGGEYDLPLDHAPERILDLGANVGISALHFRRTWPEAAICCVEANPALHDVLRRNVAELDVEVREVAVAPVAGTVRFQQTEESWSGHVLAGGSSGTEVDAVGLDDLLSAVRPDLVKFDVEGAELEAFPVADLSRVRAWVGEVHVAPGSTQMRELLRSFEEFSVSLESDDDQYTLLTAVASGAHEVRRIPHRRSGAATAGNRELARAAEAFSHHYLPSRGWRRALVWQDATIAALLTRRGYDVDLVDAREEVAMVPVTAAVGTYDVAVVAGTTEATRLASASVRRGGLVLAPTRVGPALRFADAGRTAGGVRISRRR